MNNETARQIGNLVVAKANNDMLKSTAGNYGLSDYIDDFEGTQEELNIALIKWVARLI